MVLLVAIAAVLGFLWLRSSDVFALEELALPEPRYVAPEEVSEVLAPYAHESLLALPLEEIRSRLEAIPYVRTASLHRGLPHSLRVELEEHEPWARVRGKEGDWLVAADGTILEKLGGENGSSAEEPSAMPLLVPAEPTQLQVGRHVSELVLSSLEAIRGLEANWPADYPVKRVTVTAGGDLSVWLESGTELRLGEPSEVESKLTVAREIMKVYSRDGGTPAYIDVQLPSRPVAKAR